MLLLHQTGSVKIGEVVRYTVTYTPSQDRILPSPESLYLRIKNSSAIALRAAFVHGPYNLSVAAWPSKYNPNEKFVDEARIYGVPEFEPMLKAGGSWTCHLIVPDHIRQSAGTGHSGQYFGGGPEHDGESVTWVIEVASQVIFSTSAAVHYDIMLARDQKALNLPSMMPGMGNQTSAPQPGRVSDYQQSKGAKEGKHAAQSKGIFSRAIYLKVEDTASMWNTPQLSGMEQSADNSDTTGSGSAGAEAVQTTHEAKPTEQKDADLRKKKKTKVHLVILTHGLHSNLGSDLLYMKESIDAAAKQARIDAKARRQREKDARKAKSKDKQSTVEILTQDATSQPAGNSDAGEETEEEEEDPQVIVRGFSGNATRTERGIKYLGKRLARYVLCVTYPDQPFLPAGKAAQDVLSHVLKGEAAVEKAVAGNSSHKHSTIKEPVANPERSYQITNISFIAHSLGGLVQTYAVAYIQKHSPQFFDRIKPINFVALASPFLGLNHENPMYVKFALDFGLVGRTGQDLGLTWRAPTIARNGWGAIVSNLGESAHKKVLGESQPESKPLLRILPTGPAHVALKKFRNRTVYSNVVNDGIVPLRTSCLLFLDWQGLGRVDKARREAGLVETVVGFGWAELTGANVTSPRNGPWAPQTGSETEMPSGTSTPLDETHAHDVPQPPTDAVMEDDRASLRPATAHGEANDEDYPQSTANTNNNNPFTGLFSFFKQNTETPKQPATPSAKQTKIYQRSQTLPIGNEAESSQQAQSSKVTTGHELDDDAQSGISAPPKTSFFESAGDVLNPKLPSVEYLIDPEQRPRTIFHDRVYHPEDIPAPPLKKRPTGTLAARRATIKRSLSGSGNDVGTRESSPFLAHPDSTLSSKDYDDTAHTNPDKEPDEVIDGSSMKVEEKIARAYHRNLSWRKVLVKLEPDAHNNLICRRMFANAFGWPVVKHLVDAHFSDAATTRLRDEDLQNTERAKGTSEAPDKHGNETQDAETATTSTSDHVDTQPTGVDDGEARDTVSELPSATDGNGDKASSSSLSGMTHERADNTHWSDRDWADSGDDSDSDVVAPDNSSSDGRPKGQGQAADEREKAQPERSTSPLSSAYWTEKIVGKGATQRQSRLASNKSGDDEGAQVAPAPPLPPPLLSPGSAAGHVGLAEYPT
ncbi:putative serine esterase-domain-containing protein [Coniella lustricola]|uniref:Putative serine esterase-domain-containing protein n=1 Tax=Coniella lustricola TaxID=2025994 RepID=A0A2T3AKV5_9PEZI|nr:putative serine esterase-domain-containing protein [Coniella lustricola]